MDSAASMCTPRPRGGQEAVVGGGCGRRNDKAPPVWEESGVGKKRRGQALFVMPCSGVELRDI